MFNLDLPTDNLKKARELLNDINSNYRVGEKNEDGSLTTLKFKTQDEFDKATEVLKTL
jgi:hypothetical protein